MAADLERIASLAERVRASLIATSTSLDAVGRSARGAEDALEGVGDAAEESAKALDKVRELSAKAFGGDEFAGKFKDFGDALKIARGRTEDLGGGAVSMGTRLRAGASAAVFAGQALTAYGGAVLDTAQRLAEMSAQVDETERRMHALGATYDQVRDATQGTIGATDAFAMREELLTRGLQLGGDQLAVVTRQMREWAIVHGTTAPQAMAQFTAAVESGDRVALARFGLSLDQATDATSRLHLAVSRFSGQQAEQSIIPETQTEALQRQQREMNDLGGRVARLAFEYSGLRAALQAYESVASTVNDLLGRDADAAEAVASSEHRAREQTALMTAQAGQAQDALRGMAAATTSVATATNAMSMELAKNEKPIDRLVRRLGAARAAALAAREQSREDASIDRQLRAEGLGRRAAGGASGPRAAEQATGGGLGGMLRHLREGFDRIRLEAGRDAGRAGAEEAHARAQAQRELQVTHADYLQQLREEPALLAERQRISDRLIAGGQVEAGLLAEINRIEQRRIQLVGNNSEAARLEVASGERRAAMLRDQVAAVRELARAQAEANDAGKQFYRALSQQAGQAQTATQTSAGIMASAWGSVTAAAGAHFDALITGRETFGEAVMGMAHDALKGLAVKAVGEALANYAAGFAALTNPVTAAAVAPQHFTSAALWTAVAALGGIGAAVSAPRQAAPPAAGSAGAASLGSSASRRDSGGDRSGGDTYVFNIDGGYFANERAADQVAHLMSNARRRGKGRGAGLGRNF